MADAPRYISKNKSKVKEIESAEELGDFCGIE